MYLSGGSLFGGTTVAGVAYAGYRLCDSTIVNGKFDKARAIKPGVTSIATGVSTTVASAYSAGLQSAHRTASAYIESLDDQQLACLVEKLESKEETMSNVINLEESKEMIKKL